MSIEIKLYNKKWRLIIREQWEFDTPEEMKRCLNELLEAKNVHGQQHPKKEEVVGVQKKGEILW